MFVHTYILSHSYYIFIVFHHFKSHLQKVVQILAWKLFCHLWQSLQQSEQHHHLFSLPYYLWYHRYSAGFVETNEWLCWTIILYIEVPEKMLVEMLIIEDVFRIEPPKQKLQLLLRWFCSLITKVKVALAGMELSDMCGVSKQFCLQMD